MSICRYCGEEITFRYIDGILRPIHAYGMPCGERAPYSDDSLKRAVHTRCPRCSQMVWLVHHNGGKVWVDELGWPWPKHPCFDTDASRAATPSWTSASTLPDRGWRTCEFCKTTVQLNRYADHLATCKLAKPPILLADAHFQPKHPCRKCEFCNSMVRLDHYSAHVSKVHKMGNQVATPEIASAQIGQSVTVPPSSDDEGPNTGQGPTASSNISRPLDKHGLVCCEFCKARLRPDRYSHHLQKVHSAIVAFQGAKARRLCSKCCAVVEASLYDQHLREKHGTGIPSSTVLLTPPRKIEHSGVNRGVVAHPALPPKASSTSFKKKKRRKKHAAKENQKAIFVEGLIESDRKRKKSHVAKIGKDQRHLLQGGLCSPR